MDCIFCAIVAGKIPAAKVYEDEHVLAFMDIAPANPGHTLVIPKQHYRNIFDMPPEIGGKIMEVAIRLAAAIRKALNPDGLNLFQSNEPAAFQTVFHFHLHLIPRWAADPLRLPWHPSEGDLEAIGNIAAKIQAAQEAL
ncbi:HIT family protein [Candidatus Poribacteria bacterium]|nr:MAG: HIT family protein [Candidatus Poribacteria bacterium]